MSDISPIAVFIYNNQIEQGFWQKQSKDLPIDLYYVNTNSPSEHYAEVDADQITNELVNLYDYCIIPHNQPVPICFQDKANATHVYVLNLENNTVTCPIEETKTSLKILAIVNDLKLTNKKGKEIPLIGTPILAIELLTKTVCLQCPLELEEKLNNGQNLTTNHKEFSDKIDQLEYINNENADILFTNEKYPNKIILAPKDLAIIAIIKENLEENKCNFEIKKLFKGTEYVMGQLAEISFHHFPNTHDSCQALSESFDGLDVKFHEISPELAENHLELIKNLGIPKSSIQAERINNTITLILLKKT